MKEELIKLLNNKLGDINANIKSLEELNEKIDNEHDKLSYVLSILEVFKGNDGYNILNFVKLEKEDFDKVIDLLEDVSKLFSTESCNYDGLVYLINGINNGISLSLTEEQKNAIESLIRGLKEKEEDYKASIDGLELVKERFEVSDLNVLNHEKSRFEKIIDEMHSNNYISDTDAIMETMHFNKVETEDIVKQLSYVLKYNADIYTNGHKKEIKEQEKNALDEKLNFSLENHEQEIHFEKPEVEVETKNLDKHDDIKFEEKKVNLEETQLPTFDVTSEIPSVNLNVDTEEKEIPEEEVQIELPKENVEIELPKVEENIDTVNIDIPKVDVEIPNEEVTVEIPKVDVTPQYDEINVSNDLSIKPIEHLPEPEVEIPEVKVDIPEVSIPNVDINSDINLNNGFDVDFQDVISPQTDYVGYTNEDEMSTTELQKVLTEYGVKTDKDNLNVLLSGNINNYRIVLDALKKYKLTESFEENKVLFNEILISSGEEEIENVLRIIKEDLSVDLEDYEITTKIAINTIPSIFIKDNGNYDNFIQNVDLFKKIGINLINLFDFSKEIFVANHDRIVENYNAVQKYNIRIDYQNAKYLLLLPHIAERMDYYVESVYTDKTNNEVFDGINYINEYAAKLNVVTDLTIKRLRYASENGKKIFGSKPKSLTGEITNLKVNALEISDIYLNNFFNNEFDGLSDVETREYIKLIRNSSNVGNYTDELADLEKYHQGLRYVINGVNISYNKVIRNYNALRSYGISSDKARHFAICYNLIITKEEYQTLKTVLGLGGNQ